MDALSIESLLRCCGSRRWAERVLARGPFADRERLLAAADEIWAALEPADWLEAFSHHPRIGEKAKGWEAAEQAGTAGAAAATLAALAKANAEYERRFGHIFLVCATGKSADEILALLRARLPNDPVTELRIAAGEQSKITKLRLAKLLGS